MNSDERIFEFVKLELDRARKKYPNKRNPLQSLNPIFQEVYEAKNELEADKPDFLAARKELIQVICVTVRAIDAIDEHVAPAKLCDSCEGCRYYEKWSRPVAEKAFERTPEYVCCKYKTVNPTPHLINGKPCHEVDND